MSNSPNRLRWQVFTLTALLLIAMGLVLPDAVARKLSAYEFFDRLVDIRGQLVRNYVESPDQSKLVEGAIEGMLQQLNDPYTAYFTAEELQSFERHTSGSFSGIGAEISQQDDYIVIVTPLEDSPAYEAGLVAGDLIIAVDGESLEGVSTNEAVKRITGPEGTDVTLTIRHPDGTVEDVVITRQRIEIQTVKGFHRKADNGWDYMLDADNRIGYIRMTQFSQPTYDALVQALEQLRDAGMKGLILDLRYNPGGLLDAATDIADLFIESGDIVSTKGRSSPERTYRAESDGTLPRFPMVVLVNEGSASASEILAGALKDNDRAIVLGSRTVGKGSVQQIVPLEGNNGGLKLTTSYYYLPSGRNIHRREDADVWGVDPNDGFYLAMDREEQVAMMKIRRQGEIIRPEDADDADGNQADDNAASDAGDPEEASTNGSDDNASGDTDASDGGASNADGSPPSDEADATEVVYPGPGEMNPAWIRDNLKDKQLAAALETMMAKLDTGAWQPVGADSAAMQAQLTRRENLEKARNRLQEQLTEIGQEIEKINQRIASGEVPEDEAPTDEADEAGQAADAATGDEEDPAAVDPKQAPAEEGGSDSEPENGVDGQSGADTENGAQPETPTEAEPGNAP